MIGKIIHHHFYRIFQIQFLSISTFPDKISIDLKTKDKGEGLSIDSQLLHSKAYGWAKASENYLLVRNSLIPEPLVLPETDTQS